MTGRACQGVSLSVAGSVTLEFFHPRVRSWFLTRFGQPTEVQRRAWEHIAADENVLVAAPTGSGKTLAAFLVCLDRLVRRWEAGRWTGDLEVVYVSPLRALSNDIERNLTGPLQEIQAAFEADGLEPPPIRTAVRTGDTSASARRRIVTKPPQILVTTPESLYLMLTSERARSVLSRVSTVIVDEIHALARDKRGSHLALTLERLAAVTVTPPTRIGLSATQRPLERIASFLVGVEPSPMPVDMSAPDAADDTSPRANPGRLFSDVEQGQASTGPMTAVVDCPEVGEAEATEPTVSAFRDRPCAIVDLGHARNLDLAIETPAIDLEAICGGEHWGQVDDRLAELVTEHRATLIFVNTRRLAERISHWLSERLGEDQVACHHGSLSRESRTEAEARLRTGDLKTIVATASLELGIDIGHVDLVCQIGSPRSIATFLQRVGRSGHFVGGTPKGRLFPLTRDELIECMALVRAVGAGRLDVTPIPERPLDILYQQIVACCAAQTWAEEELFTLCRSAWPFRNLDRETWRRSIDLLTEGYASGRTEGAYLHRDGVNRRLRGRAGARMAAITCGGAIPDTAEFRVVLDGERTVLGSVDEDFAIDSQIGSIFLLGNSSWRIEGIRGGDVIVSDAAGQPPNIPFWVGEAPGRTRELSDEISDLRTELESLCRPWVESAPLPVRARRTPLGGRQVLPTDLAAPGTVIEYANPAVSNGRREAGSAAPGPLNLSVTREAATDQLKYADAKEDHFRFHRPRIVDTAPGIERGQKFVSSAMQRSIDAVCRFCAVSPFAAEQALRYHAAQIAAVGCVPTRRRFVFERFFDETGGMQLVIHAPLGMRINRAWGLALRKRFCRSFDFELQAQADENGILLSLSPQHSFPLEMMPGLVSPEIARPLLEQAVLAAPAFQARWRWNATRALGVLRMRAGQKLPPHLLRHRAEDLLAAVFPDATGCFENHHGDKEIPDHPLIGQTMEDCLTEAMDYQGWAEVLREIAAGEIETVIRQTREPSPFSHSLIHSMPYTFLDPAGLEERRARAVATRRSLDVDQVRDLALLDAEAVRTTVAEARPKIRDAEELHDAMMGFVVMTDGEVQPYAEFLFHLTAAGRVRSVSILPDARREPLTLWCAAERWASVQAAYERLFVPAGEAGRPDLPGLAPSPAIDSVQATVQIIRGRVRRAGPITAQTLARQTGLSESMVRASLEAIESEGLILRGWYTVVAPDGKAGDTRTAPAVEWCERTMLQTMHRRTLRRARDTVQPIEVADYLHFLARYHGLDGGPGLGWDDDPRTACGVTTSAPKKRSRTKSGSSGTATARATRLGRLRRVLARLEGFEAPAGAWEPVLLSRRVADYAGADLDRMFLSGELIWGRLPPRPKRSKPGISGRTQTATPVRPTAFAKSGLHRAVPISIVWREALPTVFDPDRRRPRLPPDVCAGEGPPTDGDTAGPMVSERAIAESAAWIDHLLDQRGALFTSELAALTRLSPGAVEHALRILAASGRATCDSFAAVRHFGRTAVRRRGSDPLIRTRQRTAADRGDARSLMGRWSPFPGPVLAADPTAPNPNAPNVGPDQNMARPGSGEGQAVGVSRQDAARKAHASLEKSRTARARHWAAVLLDRYGVLFRDVLRRERSAPRWSELVRVLRRLEMQGRVRSGRFIRGVAGEQFALPATVEALRQAQSDRSRGYANGEASPTDGRLAAIPIVTTPWIVVSAADPINLWGILTEGERLPAATGHRFILRAGRLVAWKRGKTTTYFEPVEESLRAEMDDALATGRRRPALAGTAASNTKRSRLTSGWLDRPADAAAPRDPAWNFWG